MKLNLISIAMLSIFSTTTFAAPTLYGEIDASIDYLPEKNATKA
ncbi:MAG: porin, partial [Acinetobacter sp.]